MKLEVGQIWFGHSDGYDIPTELWVNKITALDGKQVSIVSPGAVFQHPEELLGPHIKWHGYKNTYEIEYYIREFLQEPGFPTYELTSYLKQQTIKSELDELLK